MIKLKNNKYTLIFGAIVLLICIATFSFNVVKAETHSAELIVSEQTYEDETVVSVENITAFVANQKRLRSNSIFIVEKIMTAMGKTEDEILDTPLSIKMQYLDGTEGRVSKRVFECVDETCVTEEESMITRAIGVEQVHASITVGVEYLKTSEIYTDSQGSKNVFYISGFAQWHHPNKGLHIPQFRLKDELMLAWSGDQLVKSGDGYLSYKQYEYFGGKYKKTITETLAGSTNVTAFGLPGYGLRVQLKANSMANAYENFYTYARARVYAAPGSFNIKAAYDHSTLTSSAGISFGGSGVGADISVSYKDNENNFESYQLLVHN